jgi:ATP-dependent DNA helicase RecQ
VRLVVHYDLPPGIEDYYQEAGRAGRDGKEAYCIVVLKPSSIQQLRTRVEAGFPEMDFIKRIYRSLHLYLDIAVGAGGGETFDFDLNTFSTRFDFRPSEAFQALDILAKDGWIQIDDSSFRGSTFQLVVDVDTLYSYQVAEPLLDLLTKALLRGYEGIWTSPVHIQEAKLASFLQWPEQQVIKQLNRLQTLGLADYRKPKSKSQITLLRERVKEDRFSIDPKAYAFRKERALRRMESMEQYLKDEVSCREMFIRNYFDETDTKPCGHCDRCQSRQPAAKSKTVLLYDTLQDHQGITVKDFLEKYGAERQADIKKLLRQLADEQKIQIIEDKIFPKNA